MCAYGSLIYAQFVVISNPTFIMIVVRVSYTLSIEWADYNNLF